MSDLTDLQKQIIEEDEKDPDQSDEEIAVKLDCSASYVNQIRNTTTKSRSRLRGFIEILIMLSIIFTAILYIGGAL